MMIQLDGNVEYLYTLLAEGPLVSMDFIKNNVQNIVNSVQVNTFLAIAISNNTLQ